MVLYTYDIFFIKLLNLICNNIVKYCLNWQIIKLIIY